MKGFRGMLRLITFLSRSIGTNDASNACSYKIQRDFLHKTGITVMYPSHFELDRELQLRLRRDSWTWNIL